MSHRKRLDPEHRRPCGKRKQPGLHFVVAHEMHNIGLLHLFVVYTQLAAASMKFLQPINWRRIHGKGLAGRRNLRPLPAGDVVHHLPQGGHTLRTLRFQDGGDELAWIPNIQGCHAPQILLQLLWSPNRVTVPIRPVVGGEGDSSRRDVDQFFHHGFASQEFLYGYDVQSFLLIQCLKLNKILKEKCVFCLS